MKALGLVTIGVALVRDDDTAEALLTRADQDMYAAKDCSA